MRIIWFPAICNGGCNSENGGGTCVRLEICQCNSGWMGSSCDTRTFLICNSYQQVYSHVNLAAAVESGYWILALLTRGSEIKTMPKTYMTMISMFTVALKIGDDGTRYDAFGKHLFKVVWSFFLLQTKWPSLLQDMEYPQHDCMGEIFTGSQEAGRIIHEWWAVTLFKFGFVFWVTVQWSLGLWGYI